MPKDNERLYDKEIAPLMERILRVCKENGIPMVAVFEYESKTYSFSALEGEDPSVLMKKVQITIQRMAEGEPPVVSEAARLAVN
jgi:hypothetical protein